MLDALLSALRAQFRPRMLALALLPFAGALLLWLLIDALAWHSLVAGLQQTIDWGVTHHWITESIAKVASESIVFTLMLVFLWPLMQATALLVTATIAIPIAVTDVANRDFPQLERRRGGSLLGSVWNSLWATLVFVLLWVFTLPLWLFGIPAVVLPIVLSAWLNARLFRYDALAEHASAEEMAAVTAATRGQWFGLGVVAAVLQLVPVLNLFVTLYSGLSFVYFGLGELQKHRSAVQR